MTHPKKQFRKRGFTLVELLMVMTVMLVMMGLVIVAFPNFGKANNLTNGTQSFVDVLNQARQMALAMNRSVEVRFYYLPGPTDGTTATAYRAMRYIVCDAYGNTSTNNGTTTIYSAGANPGLVQRLPAGVVVYPSTGHRQQPGQFGNIFHHPPSCDDRRLFKLGSHAQMACGRDHRLEACDRHGVFSRCRHGGPGRLCSLSIQA